jgi:hypothetical protein
MIPQEFPMSDASNPYRTPAAFSADPLSVPYAGQSRMRLVVSSGLAAAYVRIDPDAVVLIRVDADGGPAPRLRANGDTLWLEWPRSFAEWARSLVFGGVRSLPEIVLHPAVEWSLAIRGGLFDARLDLAAGRIAGIEIGGGCSEVDLELPAISRTAPIRIAGGASHVHLRRPAGVGVSVAITGGAAAFQLDDQTFDAIGGRVELHGLGVGIGLPRYDLMVSGGASNLEIL